MAKSNYLEDEIIKHIFRTGSFTKPSALYVALYTAAPSDSGGGTEVSGAGYARIQRDPLDANWTATVGGDGETDNAADIEFGSPTADWGQITHFAIHDHATAGNMLYWGALGTAKTVNNGDPAPKFTAGSLVISED